MNPEWVYEMDWSHCKQCVTRRPDRHIGPDGKCSDGWCERKREIEAEDKHRRNGK